jgi:plastocyanin
VWRRRLLAAALVALVGGVPTAHAGAVIEGTVALPAASFLPPAAPRYPGDTLYVAGPPDPPAAVVYLETGAAGAPETPDPDAAAEPVVEMAQHHYQFTPALLAVRVGSVVRFPNQDDEYHSVFSYSKAKRFDLGRYHKDETPAELVFDQAGVVKLFCEIHEHMRGTILVLDTPYFQKTDADGRYRLEGLPAGPFVLRAWVDDTVRERSVDLANGATLHVDFPAE